MTEPKVEVCIICARRGMGFESIPDSTVGKVNVCPNDYKYLREHFREEFKEEQMEKETREEW